MIEKFNKLDNSKKIPIVIFTAIVLIVIIILFTVFSGNGSKYDHLKVDSKKGFVYTCNNIKNNDFNINVPCINIDGSSIKSINEDINSYVEDFIYNEMLNLSYEYNLNGKVLSLVIKVMDYNTKDVPKAYFKTYNINLETLELISDEELLNVYEVSLDTIETAIYKKFDTWYKEILEEGYFNEEDCDYDCFLENHAVEDYTEEVSYYIDRGKLVVYKPFTFYTIYGEDEYFDEDSFKFIVE